jgi:hypothetical protein
MAEMRAIHGGMIDKVQSQYIEDSAIVNDRSEQEDAAALSGYVLLFVDGLLSDTVKNIGHSLQNFGVSSQSDFLIPFGQQKSWAAGWKISMEEANIDVNQSCLINGDKIIEKIRSTFKKYKGTKKVVLVTHGKGGVSTLTGIVEHFAEFGEFGKMIGGWIAYQSPHGGSYLADISNKSGVKLAAKLVTWMITGAGLATDDMTIAFRKDYNVNNAKKIEFLIEKIPVISLVTTEKSLDLSGGWDSYMQFFSDSSTQLKRVAEGTTPALLSPLVDQISKRPGASNQDEIDNDGIAMVSGTCLDRSRVCVQLDEIDHFAAVMNTSPFKTLSTDDRVLLFRTLLDYLVQTKNVAK